jgi:hypothetical protein
MFTIYTQALVIFISIASTCCLDYVEIISLQVLRNTIRDSNLVLLSEIQLFEAFFIFVSGKADSRNREYRISSVKYTQSSSVKYTQSSKYYFLRADILAVNSEIVIFFECSNLERILAFKHTRITGY